MQRNRFVGFNATGSISLSLIREQDSFLAFKENPSDKFTQLKECPAADAVNNRISALELFSLFTADIIKKKTVFIR